MIDVYYKEVDINNISRPYHLSIKHDGRCKLYSLYLFKCLLERDVLFSLQLCLYRNPCLLVIDSIASCCCCNIFSVHLSVKKSGCDHIYFLLPLCGDDLLIATLCSLTLFLSPTGKSDKKVREYEFAVIRNG